jgi:hypothetical protein
MMSASITTTQKDRPMKMKSIAMAQCLLMFAAVTIALVTCGWVSPADFDLSWHTIDNGGGACSDGGGLEVAGTIGQPDACTVLTGGTLELVGGFWPGSVEPVGTCPGDITGNTIVNIDDLLAVINAWGQGAGSPGDVNNNGIVNIDDLLAVINAWGACP